MKLFNAIATAAVIGASLITATPAEARDPMAPKSPSISYLAGNYAGGYCLYKTGFYSEDAVFARVNDAGQDMGMTPEEVKKMISSPAFIPQVHQLIAQEGGCVKLSNLQLKAWNMTERATRIVR